MLAGDGKEGGTLDLPTTDREASLCEVFEVSWFSAEGWEFSRVIFPEELSLAETPLRGSSTLDVGLLG
jgi:hypothetical protein